MSMSRYTYVCLHIPRPGPLDNKPFAKIPNIAEHLEGKVEERRRRRTKRKKKEERRKEKEERRKKKDYRRKKQEERRKKKEEEEEERGDRNGSPTRLHAQDLKDIRVRGNPSLRCLIICF